MNDVTVTVIPRPNLTDQALAALAFEIARDLREPADIYKTFGITEEQYKSYIETNDWFKRVLESAMIEWASTSSTKTRIKHQAALALEEGIIPLTKRMLDGDSDLGKATEVAKLLTKLAGLDNANAEGGSPGEKFTITINLGADNQVKIEKTLNASPEIEAQASAGALPLIAQGEGHAEEVSPVSEGSSGDTPL